MKMMELKIIVSIVCGLQIVGFGHLLFGAYGELSINTYTEALWHLNGDATDETGNFDGSVDGPILTNFGKFGQAYQFTLDNINTGYYPSTSTKTIGYWVYLNSLTGGTLGISANGCNDGLNHRVYLGMRSSSGTGGSLDLISFGYGNLYTGTGSGFAFPWETGKWYHLLMSCNSSCYMYVNGEQKATLSNPSFSGTSTTPLLLGGWGTYQYTDAIIDEVFISLEYWDGDKVRDYYWMTQGTIIE